MADTINELYLKIQDKLTETVEEDRYFRYLYTLAQAGQNTLIQSNKTIHKNIDQDWIEAIEGAIDALYSITEKPRRYVSSLEEVVPVSLARKITDVSVRHLSMNTQFIAAEKNGEVEPFKVLNVSSEERIDLYENRFVYQLIQRLVDFIDRRTEVIFWRTGDESIDCLSLHSCIDDAYETIEYKLEMRVNHLQSNVQKDVQYQDLFMRIDRVRRMIKNMSRSAFCQLLKNSQPVRNPIQRTNLMLKDPDYRKCYTLWQFLDQYDNVGYSLEEIDTPLQFDEEYIAQLQTNMIANYAIFKSILEKDDRQSMEPPRSHVVKPKFVSRVQEVLVDNCDEEDVEIRRVFVEELTQAQLEAEEKLKVQEQRAEDAERLMKEAKLKCDEAVSRMNDALERMAMADATARRALEQRDEAQQTAARVSMEAKEHIEAAEQARMDAEQAASEHLAARNDMEATMNQALLEKENAVRDARRMERERDSATEQMISDRNAYNAARESEAAAQQALRRIQEENMLLTTKSAESDLRCEQALADRARAEEECRQAQAQAEEAQRIRQEAEEKHREAVALSAESARSVREADRARQEAERRLQEALERAAQARQERDAAQRASVEARTYQQQAHEQVLQAQQEAERAQTLRAEAMDARQAAEQEATQIRLRSEQVLRQYQHHSEQELQQLKEQSAQELQQTKSQAEEKYQQYKAQTEKQYQELKEQSAQELQQTKSQAEEKYQQYKAQTEERYRQLKEQSEQKLQEVKDESEERYRRLKMQSDLELQQLKIESAQELRQTKSQSAEEYQQLKSQSEQEIQQLRRQLQQETQQLRRQAEKEIQQLKHQLEKEHALRLRAQQRADATPLSARIRQAFGGNTTPEKQDEEDNNP